MPHLSLTATNIRFIKANRLKMPGCDMAQKFGVSKSVVNRYMRENGLAAPKELQIQWRGHGNLGKTTSTPKTDRILRSNYLVINVNQLSQKIQRSETFVKVRLRQLNLVIPQEIIEQRKMDSRIKPGNIPANKGKRQKDYMSKSAIKNTMATRFKKGQLPHNAIGFKNGDIRVRQCHSSEGGRSYKWIRLALGKWQLLHIDKWEKKHNRKLPKGHCLWFKDGNPMNCNLKNLELITRAENARRYRSKFLELPKPMQTTARLLNKLNKSIHGKKQVK